MKPFYKTASIILPILILGNLLFTSCVSRKKIENLNQEINNRNQLISDINRTNDSIQNIKNNRAANNEIDPQTIKGINKLTDSIKASIEDKNLAGVKPIVKRIKRRKYKVLNEQIIVANTKLSNLVEDAGIVNDLLHTTSVERFNTGAFFGSGKYELAPDAIPAAQKAFTPIITKFGDFEKKYPNKKLEANFVILGYADEQPISEGSELYQLLSKDVKDPNPTRQQLNLALSQRRSLNISQYIKSLVDEQKKTALQINYISQGRGEEHPNPSIKDYQENDERRRIVMIFWSILPEL